MNYTVSPETARLLDIYRSLDNVLTSTENAVTAAIEVADRDLDNYMDGFKEGIVKASESLLAVINDIIFDALSNTEIDQDTIEL